MNLRTKAMNADKPIPTPRTDAAFRGIRTIGHAPTELQKASDFARQLETELSTAIASLAAALARCAVKDEALQSAAIAFAKAGMFSDAELASNASHKTCAVPWLARYDAMRVALEELADLVDDARIGTYVIDSFTTQAARKALEDEPK